MLLLSNPHHLDLSPGQCAMSTNSRSSESVSTSDNVMILVHSLMCHRQSGESEEFARRAIESLVKKLRERQEDLDSLMTAITTNGSQPSKCVTIQRTLDGRMQIAGRKCLPHIIYARIWRWPDLHRNELKHSRFCMFGFDLKQDFVCINPYHYERVVSSVDLATLSLSPVVERDICTDSDSESNCPESIVLSSGIIQTSAKNSCPSNSSENGENHVSSTTTNSRPRLSVQDLIDDQRPSCTDSNPIHEGDLTSTSHFSNISNPTSPIIATNRVNPTPHLDRGYNTMAWSGVANPSAQNPTFTSQRLFHRPDDLSVNMKANSHVNEKRNLIEYPISTSSNPLSENNVLSVNTSCTTSFVLNGNNSNQHHNFPSVSGNYSSSLYLPNQGVISLSGNMNGAMNNSSNKHSGGGSAGNNGAGSGSCSNNAGRDNGSSFNSNNPCGSGANSGGGSGGGWGNRRGPPPFAPSGSILQPLPVLTTQRPPEYWCNIAYFELDQQVGELFKVPSQYSRVTIDGYTDPSSPNRFCLGQLSNVHRPEQSEKSRLYIGKGVELDNVGEGDVWIRCLSEFSVFVQSYYLDREAGRAPGDAVHKIYPGAYIKVFDIRQCHEEMKSLAQSAQVAAVRQAAAVVGSLPSPTSNDILSQLPGSLPQPNPGSIPGTLGTGASLMATAGVGVDDLRRLCMLRLSFVKGWGPDYPRRSIKETPCWIEIQLHRPLQLLDEVLQAMPLNDLKPTRHFFSYFPQPQSQPPSATPSQAGCVTPRTASTKRA